MGALAHAEHKGRAEWRALFLRLVRYPSLPQVRISRRMRKRQNFDPIRIKKVDDQVGETPENGAPGVSFNLRKGLGQDSNGLNHCMKFILQCGA